MRVLHYVDADNISWLKPYIEIMKSLDVSGIEQALMCRPDGEMERYANDNGITTLTFRPVIATFDKPAKAKYYSNTSHCISCAEWLKNYMASSQGINTEEFYMQILEGRS